MLHSNSHFSTKIVRRYLYHNFKNPYTLTGCDATSKTGKKAAALKANYHLLASLGQNRRPISLALKQTEKYLWSAPYSKKNCHAFDDLRYVLYTKKNKTVWFLPPTSNMSHGHNLGWLYFDLICSNLISVPEINLNPVEFGWNPVDSVFLPNKCIEEMHCKMSVQQVSVSALHAQNFASALEKNVVPKFTNRLSWTLHNICKYTGFLWSTFPVYGQNLRTYTGKYVSEETRIFLC